MEPVNCTASELSIYLRADAKSCGKCGASKPLCDFYKSNQVAKSWCKSCAKEYQKDLYQKDPQRAIKRAKKWREKYAEKVAVRRKENRAEAYLYELERKYGLNQEDAHKLLRDQGNKCEICKVNFDENAKRNLDHCHATGKIRGFLCRRCNSVLGLVNDDSTLLGNCIRYIHDHAK